MLLTEKQCMAFYPADPFEFPMPEVGDRDILVKVEGCGICGTDAHEFKRDPFGLIPVALGHEGTGEIVIYLCCISHYYISFLLGNICRCI